MKNKWSSPEPYNKWRIIYDTYNLTFYSSTHIKSNLFYSIILFSSYQYWSPDMHGGSGIILDAIKLKEINIFQNYFSTLVWSINKPTQKNDFNQK